MVEVQNFSEGKISIRNEDYFDSSGYSFVLADGATDKTSVKYHGKTGGELISRLVVKESLSSELNGTELVDLLNKKVYQLYRELGITEKVRDPIYRFACGFICVRDTGGKIVITYLGDLGFRINGAEVYQEINQVDIENAEERAKYIAETGDLEGSRKHILPFLLEQFKYQNNPQEALGYGVIDGTNTPGKFVKTFDYDKDEIRTIELITDGYFDIPQEVSIAAWEKSHAIVELEDPDKWKNYKSVKSNDDRTIAIIKF